MVHSGQRRVAVVTNIVAPYRTPVLRELARKVELRVFYSAESEPNRQWSVERDPGFGNEVLAGPALNTNGKVIYVSPRLVWRLRAFRPSAVVVGGFSLPTVYALLYCLLSRANLIVMNEGTRHTERGLGRVARLMRWATVRAARAYVAVSGLAEQRFYDLGAERSRCVVVPYALDVANRPTRDYSLAGRVARVLYVGQFIERKGLMQLLDAIDRIGGRHAVQLTIVGHGPLETDLRTAIATRSLEGSVTLRGFVDQPELPALYAEHDLFVFPSLEETFGVVLLEAMAAGLPAIASRTAGATCDFVDPGKTGWTMDPSTPDGIARALEEALASRRLWPDLGAEARRRMEARSPRLAAEGLVRAVEIAESSGRSAYADG